MALERVQGVGVGGQWSRILFSELQPRHLTFSLKPFLPNEMGGGELRREVEGGDHIAEELGTE